MIVYPGDVIIVKLATAKYWRIIYLHFAMTMAADKPPTYLTTAHVGYRFFSTTKKKPFFWTGTSWVDATGAAATP